MNGTTFDLDGQHIEISRPEKWMYPDELSKADVAEYFRAVSEVLLPQVRDRPLSLRRFPDGIDGESFFQKAVPDYFPDWIRTIDVPQRSGEPDLEQVVCENAATLLYLANQACLELHGWLSPASALDCPDRFVVDIDPPDGVQLSELRSVARKVRDLFDAVGLTPFVQATGGKGFHVTAPLDGGDDYEIVRPFARELAKRLVHDDPDRLTVEQRKASRGDRIFLDVNRNAYGQTAIVPYSPRARTGAPVATPLEWAELGRSEPAGHRIGSVEKRLARKADPWRDITEYAGSARRARAQLEKV